MPRMKVVPRSRSVLWTARLFCVIGRGEKEGCTVQTVFWPGIVVMVIGAALALLRGRVCKKNPNIAAVIGLTLACAGALMTVLF